MKKSLVATILLIASSYGFADIPAPAPTIVGTWAVSSMACSSGAPLTGGIKIGQDTMEATFNADKTVQFNATISGCAMTANGTYDLSGSILKTTITQAQTCKDKAPIAMNETGSCFVAHMDDKEAVAVETGKDALKVCPAGNALIITYVKKAPMLY